MAKPEHKFPTVEQSKILLNTAKGDRLETPYALALLTGCREGELLAVRWRNVDLVAVARPPRVLQYRWWTDLTAELVDAFVLPAARTGGSAENEGPRLTP